MDRLGPPVETDLEENLRQGVGDHVVDRPLEPLREEVEEDGEGKDGHVAGSLLNPLYHPPAAVAQGGRA